MCRQPSPINLCWLVFAIAKTGALTVLPFASLQNTKIGISSILDGLLTRGCQATAFSLIAPKNPSPQSAATTTPAPVRLKIGA